MNRIMYLRAMQANKIWESLRLLDVTILIKKIVLFKT